MFKQLGIFILSLCFVSIATTSFAEYVKVKAKGAVETKFIRTATTGQKKLALESAKKEVLKKYISGLANQAKARMLNDIMDKLLEDIDTYVPEVATLNDGKWENGYWTVAVEGSVDSTQLEEAVNKFAQANIKKQPKAKIVFVFVARAAKDRLRYEDRVTNRTIEEESVVEKNADDDNGGSAASVKRAHDKTTGGSTLQQSAKVSYESYNSDDLDASVSQIFVNARFKAVIPSQVGILKDKFGEDFERGGNISSATEEEAIALARAKKVDYLAVATIDIDKEDKDPSSGLYRVMARAKGYVLDIREELAERVGSIKPIQKSGMEATETAAKALALDNAAAAMAEQLVDQLRVERGDIE